MLIILNNNILILYFKKSRKKHMKEGRMKNENDGDTLITQCTNTSITETPSTKFNRRRNICSIFIHISALTSCRANDADDSDVNSFFFSPVFALNFQ